MLSNEIITAPAASLNADGRHLFWSKKPSDSLLESIREFGQAAPVLARETESGLELVAGHARLAALRDLERPVLVRLVTDADESDLGLLYLADNAQRPLDDGMRLAALTYFARSMDEKALRADILPRLGVKPKSKDARLLLGWLTMDAAWQGLLTAGHVPLASADMLNRMTEADRHGVESLFTGFSWSRSNAVNVLTWLFETSKMTGKSVPEVLEQAGMKEILAQGLSPKDAITRLVAAARLARYPELSALQETFAKTAGSITAGTRWRLNQPNNFETGGAELSIQVKDRAQLERAVDDLRAMVKASGWETIWGLGGGNDK